MTITVEQMKAARAFLSLSQKDLARRSGYALPTLNNIEREITIPRPQTMEHIQQALEEAGVQFLDKTGVRLVKEILDIQMLEGQDCLKILYEDIYDYLRDDGGEVLLSNIEEERFINFDKETMFKYFKRIGSRNDIYNKLLFRHGDTNILRPELFEGIEESKDLPKLVNSEWRWLPKNLFGLAPMIVYGNKSATILWGDHVRVVLIHNASIAETYRKQFMAIWQLSEKIPRRLLGQ